CSRLGPVGDRAALPSFPTRRSSDLGLSLSAGRLSRLRRGGSRTRGLVQPVGPRQRRELRAAADPARAVRAPCAGIAERSTPRKRSEEHTSELQSRENLVCRLLLEKK